MQTHPTLVSLVCSSCSSDRDFASDFLQIPPHDGHPCPWLVVPTTKPTTDFHRQVVAHAGHTLKSYIITPLLYSPLNTYLLSFFSIFLSSINGNSYFALILFSISNAISGFSFKYCLAFSLPCPNLISP